jgi:hypothetical protein
MKLTADQKALKKTKRKIKKIRKKVKKYELQVEELLKDESILEDEIKHDQKMRIIFG